MFHLAENLLPIFGQTWLLTTGPSTGVSVRIYGYRSTSASVATLGAVSDGTVETLSTWWSKLRTGSVDVLVQRPVF